MEAASGVEGHKEVEDDLELLEDVHEASGIGFTAGCQVSTDFFIGLGIAGQLFVLGCQLSDLSDFFINHRNGEKRHFEGLKQMSTLQLQLLSEEHWRWLAWHARDCHNSRGGTRQGVRGHYCGVGRKF